MTAVTKAMDVQMANTTDVHDNRLPAMAETQAEQLDEHLATINKRVVPAPVVDGVQTTGS